MTINQEQKEALEAIKYAIQMEIDGKKYYGQASRRSNNKLGKDLFLWLAGEEDKHRRTFENIFNSLQKQESWPEVDRQPPKGAILDTVFGEEMKAGSAAIKSVDTELESISIAMEMETKTREFYQGQTQKVGHAAGKRLYSALAAEEEGHYLALVDYREYLIDPAGYFRKTEHHSLDGG